MRYMNVLAWLTAVGLGVGVASAQPCTGAKTTDTTAATADATGTGCPTGCCKNGSGCCAKADATVVSDHGSGGGSCCARAGATVVGNSAGGCAKARATVVSEQQGSGGGSCGKATTTLAVAGSATGGTAAMACPPGCGGGAQGGCAKAGATVVSDQGGGGHSGCGGQAGATTVAGEAGQKAGCGQYSAFCDQKAKAARAGVPQMTFRVGEELTNCPQHAQQLAKGDAKAVKYVVGEAVFDTEVDGRKAWTAALESHLGDMLTVKFAVGDECMRCPMSAQSLAQQVGKPMTYRVASFDFATREAADKALADARGATEKAAMKWQVGDKSFCCGATAAQEAKDSGKPLEFVVGEAKTPCEATASVSLALARIDAAIGALQSALAAATAEAAPAAAAEPSTQG